MHMFSSINSSKLFNKILHPPTQVFEVLDPLQANKMTIWWHYIWATLIHGLLGRDVSKYMLKSHENQKFLAQIFINQPCQLEITSFLHHAQGERKELLILELLGIYEIWITEKVSQFKWRYLGFPFNLIDLSYHGVTTSDIFFNANWIKKTKRK